ncbi:DUF2798 domain-containing protein [Metaclostridioides mangenotii]|uniref:Magnesium-transporting ATPase (P-type) n=1 Tax=Metaclostridioides mangenotii TaxID=1540 RepID=A0ABS4ED41_9FIRM|nr:DUF2798 domain-containing protein [Clostridioides mangenotii]MBP1855865.1 magnesium-transporting ATPase (P-type) [Clostridioides mangenotii]
MPQNKKEGLFFTTIVCFFMVLGMSSYNLLIHSQLTVQNLIIGFIPGFIIAFFIDIVIVSSAAKKIAFSLPIKKDNKIHLVIAISTCMVLGMVTFMSMYGVIMQFGFTNNFLQLYIATFTKNVVAALPLQLIIVGPLCRFFLSKVQDRQILSI